jgi:DNA-binding transcriptional MerR regulator
MPRQLLAPQHAAAQVGLSTSRLIQLEALGELRSIRDSAGRRFYDPDVIEAFVRRRAARREAQRERDDPRPAA